MTQSKKWSVIETAINILIGYTIATLSQTVIFPVFDIHVTVTEHIYLGLFFTIVSVIRSYSLRRFFNWIHSKGIGTQ